MGNWATFNVSFELATRVAFFKATFEFFLVFFFGLFVFFLVFFLFFFWFVCLSLQLYRIFCFCFFT